MLQWMGGSRRKVTTSRKSTEKRQKQYFEQRKRQQQQEHGSAFTENNVDGFVTCEHQKGNRSLDILSLQDVSKVTEECKPLCERVPSMFNKATSASPIDKGDSASCHNHTYSASYHTSTSAPAITAKELTATECNVLSGTRVTSSHQAERVFPKGPREKTSTGNNMVSDYFKSASSIQPSIFDIIGDDEAISTTEDKAVQEAHVAFSVEGLGKVGTETPMQSPQHPGSVLDGEQSSFKKDSKKFNKCKNFNMMLDDFEMEVDCSMKDDIPPSRQDCPSLSSIDPELSTFKDGMQLDGKLCKRNSLYYEDNYDNFWNDRSPCLDGYQVDEKCGVNWKKNDATNNSFFWRNDPSDFKCEKRYSPSMPRCQEEVPDRFDNIDGDLHFASFGEPKYSSFVGSHHLQDYFSPLDKMDSLSSFSGESCSSTAVGGESTVDMPSARLRRRYGKDLDMFSRPYEKDVYDEEMWNIPPSTSRQEEKCKTSRKHKRPNSSRSTSAFYSQAPISECEGYQLFEKEFPIPKVNSHPGSFFASSKINQHYRGESFGRDSFGLDAEADFRKSNCLFDDFEENTPSEFSSGNFAFHQPYCARQSFNTSSISKAAFREKSCEVYEEVESAFPASESSAEGSVVEEVGDKSKSQPSCPKKFFEVSTENKNTTPESRLPSEKPAFKDYGYGGMTNNGLHQEVFTHADTDAEETSLPIKLQHESDEELNTPTKELRGDTPVPCQQKIEDRDVNDDNLKGPNKPKTTFIDPSCQLLTVERYVFKLFSVPKGKAAAWSAVKLF